MTPSIAWERRVYVAAELVRHRVSAKLTQAEAAARLGWSRAKLAAMEGGKQAVTVDDLFKVADCYNFSVASFLPTAWYKPELAPTDQVLALQPGYLLRERMQRRARK